jgi:GR25 family glycosyltransferase involved in LPS biosynthesis
MEKTYVINLKECQKRMKSMSENLGHYGISYDRWDATKGSDLTPEELREKTTYSCRNFFCNNGTIGCHLSHIRIWENIAIKYGCDRKKWFLILEDDAKINDKFVKNLKGVFNDLEAWEGNTRERFPEFIHLSCNMFCRNGKQITPHISTSFTVTTTRAYLISAAGACKLADKIRVVSYHVDVYMTLHQIFENTLAYYVTDNYVANGDDFVSTISSNTFPRLVPDIFNVITSMFGLGEYHIYYNGPIISFMQVINLNMMIFLFVVIIAFLISKGYTMYAIIYICIELMYYYVRLKINVKQEC